VWEFQVEGQHIPFKGQALESEVRKTKAASQRLKPYRKEEVSGLLVKGAIQHVPCQEVKEEWYSIYFIVPQNWGLETHPQTENIKPDIYMESLEMGILKNGSVIRTVAGEPRFLLDSNAVGFSVSAWKESISTVQHAPL
jgi:hypothetical protein